MHFMIENRERGDFVGFQWERFALWLSIFIAISLLFVFAQFDDSWDFIRIIVGGIFVAVTIGICFDWAGSTQSVVNSRNIILGGVLFWVLADPLQMREGIEGFSPGVVLWTLFYVVLFMWAALVGYSFTPYRGASRFVSGFGDLHDPTVAFWSVAVICLLGFIPIIYESQGSWEYFWWLLQAGYAANVDQGWRRAALGDHRDFLVSLAGIIRFAVPFLGTFILRQKCFRFWQKWCAVIMVAAVIMIEFFSGSRRTLAFIVLGPLSYLFISLLPHLRRRWAIAFVAVPIILLWFMQAQVQFRSTGFYEFDTQVIETDPFQMHRDNNFYFLAMAVDTMPKYYDFTGDWVFLNLLTHPIPRFLWPDKPFTTGLPFMSWNEAGATLSTSVVGDFYISQGIWGVVIGGLLYGWAGRNWDQLHSFATDGNMVTLIYCLGLGLFLLGIRSFWDVVANWYVLGAIMLMAYFLHRRIKVARPRSVV